MTEMEKLRALLPHWMEHNDEHAAEYERWAAKARLAGHDQVAEWIRSVAQQMVQSNRPLQQALDELGGPVSLDIHPHTH